MIQRGGLRGVTFQELRLQGKKEEFTGIMETCCLGTPFPRSALFLLTALWKTPNGTRVLKDIDCK
jgi:hypothetical protein